LGALHLDRVNYRHIIVGESSNPYITHLSPEGWVW
jgi:hypothetical protein